MPVAGSQRPNALARCTSQAATYCSAPPWVYPDSVRGAGRARRAGRRGADLGLGGGLLIRADHVVVLAGGLAVPDPGIQVEDPAGVGGEGVVAGKNPRPQPPRLDRVPRP